MLRVTVELVPYGEEFAKRTLYELRICNVGGTQAVGDYDLVLFDKETGEYTSAGLKGFNRDLGALALLKQALEAFRVEEP